MVGPRAFALCLHACTKNVSLCSPTMNMTMRGECGGLARLLFFFASGFLSALLGCALGALGSREDFYFKYVYSYMYPALQVARRLNESRAGSVSHCALRVLLHIKARQ